MSWDFSRREYWPSSALSADPSEEPLTLAEAKAHLGIDDTAADAQISAQITAARATIEAISGRCCTIQRTWTALFASFPNGPLILPGAPLVSVASVKYWDSADVEQTVGAVYYAQIAGDLGFVALKFGQIWPAAILRPGLPITVTYTAGYANTSAVPQRWKRAIALQIERDYWFRPAVAGSGNESTQRAAIEALDQSIASLARPQVPHGVTIMNAGG